MTKQLPGGKGVLLEESDIFGEHAFRYAAAAEFPELAAQLNECEGVHITMGVLATAARSAIDAGDMQRAQSILDLLDRAVTHPKAISDIENAVAVSFIPPAELRESVNGRRALEKMSGRIRNALLEQERRENAVADRLSGG